MNRLTIKELLEKLNISKHLPSEIEFIKIGNPFILGIEFEVKESKNLLEIRSDYVSYIFDFKNKNEFFTIINNSKVVYNNRGKLVEIYD